MVVHTIFRRLINNVEPIDAYIVPYREHFEQNTPKYTLTGIKKIGEGQYIKMNELLPKWK